MINDKKLRRSRRKVKKWNEDFKYKFRHSMQEGNPEPHTFMGIPLHVRPSKPLHDPKSTNRQRHGQRALERLIKHDKESSNK